MAGSTGASAAAEGSGCEHTSQSSTSGKDVLYVRDQDSLGPGHHRLCDRPAGDLERDGVDGLAPRLPARARPPVVRASALPVLSAASVFLVVVRLRRLRARHIHRRRLHSLIGRHHRRGRRDRHVGLARPGSEECRDLRLRALGAAEGDRSRRAQRTRWRRSRPLPAKLSSSRWAGACVVLRADAIRQGRRPGHPVASDLAWFGDRPRHQGRELAAHCRLPRPAWSRAPV